MEIKEQMTSIVTQFNNCALRFSDFELLAKTIQLQVEDFSKRLQDQADFVTHTKSEMLDQLRSFNFEIEKELIGIRKDQTLAFEKMNQVKVETQKSIEIGDQLDKKVSLASEEINKLAKRHENDILQLTTKKDFEKQNQENAQAMQRLQYVCTDIRNLNLTTDQYIDQYFPFKLMKDVSAYLQWVFQGDDDCVARVKTFEKI